MRNTEKVEPIFLIFLFGVAGIGVSLTVADFLRQQPMPEPALTTRFYVISESEMIFGRPVFYRTILENLEGTIVDYDLKVRLGGKTIYDQEIRLNNSDSMNQTISFIPNQTGDYQKLEFLLFKNNELYRTRTFQVSRANESSSTPDSNKLYRQNADTSKDSGTEFSDTYSKQWFGDNIVYTFNSGEKLELKISNGIVSKEDAVYTTASKGNNIILLGDLYEKTLPTSVKYLNQVIMNASEITLKTNDTLHLKNSYSISLDYLDDKSLKFMVSKGNRILREITGSVDLPVEYWEEINDYKKQKIIHIAPKKISQGEIVFDIIQYGGNKVINIGNKYDEFQVTDITEDSIILKNIQDIRIEPGKEISLVKGKIKIKV